MRSFETPKTTRHTTPVDRVSSLLDLRTEVFQAQGMVMVALAVGLAEALDRMRAYSFTVGRSLDAVAMDIVERRLDPTTELS